MELFLINIQNQWQVNFLFPGISGNKKIMKNGKCIKNKNKCITKNIYKIRLVFSVFG